VEPIDAGAATSPGPPRASAPPVPPLPQMVAELWELVVAYFKQETVVPLQKLGRYLGLGVAGSLLLGLGVVFLGMSGLRALQTETGDTFTGDWSWVPYLIVFVGLIVGAAISWKARGALRKEST
jgi:Putative Actinobacterial Holin-X, holin superfamily III